MVIRPLIRKANFYETDQMGIIHHSNYIRWFEEARIDFMEQIGFGYERAVEAGIDLAVLESYCQYKSMVRFSDTVEIMASVTDIQHARMTVSYVITDAAGGKLRSEGYTSHCFYDNRRNRPVSLKKAIPELYELFNQIKAAR